MNDFVFAPYHSFREQSRDSFRIFRGSAFRHDYRRGFPVVAERAVEF